MKRLIEKFMKTGKILDMSLPGILIIVMSVILVCCKKDDPLVIDDDDDDTTGFEVVVYSPVDIEKTNPIKLYMHFMPWFETNESSESGAWGYHWTLNNRDPNTIVDEETGKREIASHFYPLTGPYHSGDDDIIEYQLLLMKYAGVDGIIVDWYGTYDLYDYAVNLENSEAVIDITDKVGIGFAIMYEDRTAAAVRDNAMEEDIVDAATTDIDYIDYYYFSEDNYIEVNSEPLLMVFGPTSIQTEAQWTDIFSGISSRCFMTLWYESNDAGANACGEYSWVYQDNTHIVNFYSSRAPSLDFAIGSAYPGFKDYYTEGGVTDNIDWVIEHDGTNTLSATLGMATGNIDHVQLVTWNDYGEGTMIEPTEEFGFDFVEEIQSFAGVSGYDVFEDIFTQYELRKQYADVDSIQKYLDQSFYYFVSLQVDKAKEILNEFE
ncbi:MAG: hypothetical protein JW894_11295 [Bacteroidales bacterium]|nr:hypothetical protein [Bacteroidales bacterium]